MPNWYYDKMQLRNTPSVRDGISLATERRYRKEGARFIITCGTQMGLVHNTLATGVVYFHRFYMFHSFKSFPRYVTACCCLFLAGKVEETPKKCRDIIKAARSLLTDNYFYSFGEDPKEEVITLERILLQTIKFDLQVEHPYNFLLKYAKCLKGDQQKLQKMVQMAWNFVNDSLSTVVCLQWEPEIIAVALIHLASKINKFQVEDWTGREYGQTRWWEMFVENITMDILEDICHQVLDLYQQNQNEQEASNSPPQKPPSRADSPVRSNSAVLPTAMHMDEAGPSSSRGIKASNNPTSNSANLHFTAAPPAPIAHNNDYNNAQPIKSLANAQPLDLPAVPVMPAVPAASLSSEPTTHVPLPQHAASAIPATSTTAAALSNYSLYPQPPPPTNAIVGSNFTHHGHVHAPNHYRAPPPLLQQHHHMHGMYGAAPPPPPPTGGSGSNVAPYMNVPPIGGWNHQQPATNHYRPPPPPLAGAPMPPAARGYYRPPGNYGRQQQHHHQHQRY